MYVLASSTLPGWSKVGKTRRQPETRARELATGIPGKLTVYRAYETNRPRAAERLAHKVLKDHRHPDGDEWFSITPERACDALDRVLLKQAPSGRFRWLRLLVLLTAATAVLFGLLGD